MNKGLKHYTKQISQTIGNAAKISINIHKEDANLHILVPLITTVGLCPIQTSLCFNLQDKNKSELFGKGFKLNYYANITHSGKDIVVENYDGSTDTYSSDKNYFNLETGLEVKKIADDNYGAYHYEMKDKYGNRSDFRTYQTYPKMIEYKNKDLMMTDFVETNKTIDNGKGDQVKLSKNGHDFITKVEYYHNNSIVNSVEISYDNNGYISRLTYKNGNTVAATTSFTFKDNEIVVIDDQSGYRIKYQIEDNRVVSFVDGYDENYTCGYQTTITYQDHLTTVTNYKGKKTYCFFDSDSLPLYEVDDEGNIIETKYDKETKTLQSNSGVISTKHIKNIVNITDLTTFTNSGLKVEKVKMDDPIFENVVGEYAYKVTGTGSLKKSIRVHGLATDNILAILFGKQQTPKTDSSYVEVTMRCGGSISDKFSKETIDHHFQLMTLGIASASSYDFIDLEITLHGDASIELGGLQITNKEFGSFYQYDASGNATQLIRGGNTTNITYGSNNLPSSSIGMDSTMYRYEYDDYGNLIQAKTAYGAKVENTYDSIYKSNLLLTKVTDNEETKILETSKTYTSDGRFVASLTDELGNVTTYNEYDAFGKIKKVTNALNAVSKFIYNDDETLNKMVLEKDSDATDVVYSYDEKKRLSKVTLKNGTIYVFDYDSFNNIKQIKVNDMVIIGYEYDSKTGNLVKQKYGSNGDAYIFEYNDKDLVTKIYYQPTNDTKTLKFNYLYNDKDLLIKVENGNGTILNEYAYDENNQLINTKNSDSKVINTYDNLGNVVAKAIKVNDKSYYTSYDPVSRSKGSHPQSLYQAFKMVDAYLGIFDKDAVLISDNYKEGIVPINHNGEEVKFSVEREGVIPYIHVHSSNRVSYQLASENPYNDFCGSIQFWFKTNSAVSSSSKQYLFSVRTLASNSSDFIGIYLMNKKVYLEVTDYKGSTYQLLTSKYEVDLSNWNFLSLNFMNRDDGLGYADICEYDLMLNSHRQVYTKSNPRLYVDCDSYPVFNIGHNFNGKTCSNDFNGKIACLMIGRRTYLSNDVVLKYYRLTRDYIIDNQLIDADAKTVDFSQTNLFTTNQSILNNFEIYPLQNHVVSLNGKKPIRFSVRNVSSFDKDRTFNFNKSIKRYAYVADGEELVYDDLYSSSGTIAFRAYTDVTESKQYFFDGKDDSGKNLGLFRNSANKICVDFDGRTIETSLEFQTNTWHFVAFSFNETLAGVSLSDKNVVFRVLVDDRAWTGNHYGSFDYYSFKFSIGRKYEKTTISSNLGSYSHCYPLYGQIEMLCLRNAYCEASTITQLYEELKGLSKVSEFDELGLLKKVDVHTCGQTILSNTYDYKKRGSSSKYISKQVSKETIKCGATTITRSYESDALGNITKITDSTFGSHEYEYDFRGFLVKADNETYSYDSNGNMTKKGSITLTYDSVIKDRLTSFNGTTIEYDSANSLNPKRYGSNSYTFEGRRLTRLTYSGGYYEYSYNDQGQRIQKKDYRAVKWDYTYDGNRLIRETSMNGKLDFLYDEYGSLYGFIKDDDEKFFYIRDRLQNILGIVNISGQIVVKYKYDAWGKPLSVEGSLASTIGQLNPFRYKGYYYDNESGMYYCNSRYYNPQWGRFLNSDSIEYLDPESINGLNLYAYCGNDPINRFDPTGHSWKSFWNGVGAWFSDNWVKLAIGAGAIALGVLTMGVATLISGAGMAAALSAMGTAAVSSLVQVGISTAISAGIGFAVGGITSGSWDGAVDGMLNGIADGFMWGGIFAGAGQVLSGAMKITRTLAPNFNGVQIGKVKLWSPNAAGNPNTGGTLIKFGRFNRIDSEIGNMIHIHLKLLGRAINHFPIGMIAGGVIGGF